MRTQLLMLPALYFDTARLLPINPSITVCIPQPPPNRCVCALPPPGISPLAWDAGVSTVVGAASIVWVKLWTGLARRDKMKPQVWALGFCRTCAMVLVR